MRRAWIQSTGRLACNVTLVTPPLGRQASNHSQDDGVMMPIDCSAGLQNK